jgi:hypothetical protein
VAQLGSGLGSSFPESIDTRQTFQNAPVASPDSASRIDGEVVNDTLHAIINMETTLGAMPQGTFGSLAARLQQFLPGGGETPLFIGFTGSTSVSIPGTTHRLGTAALLFQVYSADTPRQALEPDSVTIDTLTYDMTVTFATPESGAISLAAPSPQYTTTFTSQTTVTIPGATHLLGTADLLVRVFTTAGTLNVLSAGSITVAAGTFDVVVTFATAESGTLILSAAGPRYVAVFTSQTTVTIPGATHGLDTPALLFQLWDAGAPRAAFAPNSLTVDPTTFDVVVTFGTPESGRLVLVQASAITGSDFDLRDAGVTNATAVRVFSDGGSLQLQMGSGETLDILSKAGTIVQTTTNAGNLSITGTATKPGGGAWLSPSDARLKRNVQPFTEGLAVVQALDPVWFRYNGLLGMRPEPQHVGLIAQAVEAVAPYMVTEGRGVLVPNEPETEILAFDGEALPFLLLNAIKELAATQAILLERIAHLETLVPPAED